MFIMISRAQPTKSRDPSASSVAIQNPLDEDTPKILSEFLTPTHHLFVGCALLHYPRCRVCLTYPTVIHNV